MIIFLGLTLPLLVGYPVWRICVFLCLYTRWGINQPLGFDRVCATMFVGHWGVFSHLVFCFHETRCIQVRYELEIYALCPLCGYYEVRFLHISQPWFLYLMGRDLDFQFIFLCHCWLLVPWGLLRDSQKWYFKHLFPWSILGESR